MSDSLIQIPFDLTSYPLCINSSKSDDEGSAAGYASGSMTESARRSGLRGFCHLAVVHQALGGSFYPRHYWFKPLP